jgi:arylsulfatase A-like enzyme
LSSGIVSHFHPPASLDPTIAWLPSLLQASGRPTGAVDHLFVMKDWFIRGYADYMPPPGRSRSPASVINELAFPWIERHANEDFFLFLHYWDAHIPYIPPEPFRTRFTRRTAGVRDPYVEQRLRERPSYPLFKRNLYDHLDVIPNLDYVADLYDAEIAYLDHELGRLFDHLERLRILDDTMVVVFGDHGENMTEHDAWFDHAGLYDSVVRVPLIIRCPSKVPARRIEAMVELTDIMPTVLELIGEPLPEGLDGRTLVPLMRGERHDHRDAVLLSECTWQAKRALRTPRWKYIRCYDPGIYPRSGPELYDLRADPAEQFNIVAARPDVAGALDRQLEHALEHALDGRPDPMLEVLAAGLPAIARLDAVIQEDAEREGLAAVGAGATRP